MVTWGFSHLGTKARSKPRNGGRKKDEESAQNGRGRPLTEHMMIFVVSDASLVVIYARHPAVSDIKDERQSQSSTEHGIAWQMSKLGTRGFVNIGPCIVIEH